MKKLGNSFETSAKPIEVETPKSPTKFDSTKPVYIPTSEHLQIRMASFRKAKTLPASLNDSANLEHIVQEFESGFMSPRSGFERESGNFVRKIVAAFEEKYKSYNDSWSERVKEKLKDSGLHRHSYSNICQSLNFKSVEISEGSTETFSTESSSTKTWSSEDLNARSPKANSYKPEALGINSSQVESQDLSLSESNSSLKLRRERVPPVIIGAFLKKPIKVEETSINWIPFPRKKLLRKKSLKKLLFSLTGKKSNRKEKEVVFASQININKESRELPDSGYDEKSVSSSSLTSINSTPEVVREKKQETIYSNFQPINFTNYNRKSTNLSTFQVLNQDEVDDESDTLSTTSKKIFLYEVPREELKTDLGPCYPSPSRIMVKSLDRRVNQKVTALPSLPKHPSSSKIPKHPFISLSKDELNEANDYEEIEFRNKIDHSLFGYDVPREILSKSEPGITNMLKFTFDKSLEETIYDVPKIRPKSSLYEDALSLKRRNADITRISTARQDYYSSPCDQSPQYATIKSRNRRYLSPEIAKSANELRSNSVVVTSF